VTPEICTCNGVGNAYIANSTGTQTIQFVTRMGKYSARKKSAGHSSRARTIEKSRPAQK